MTFQTTHSTLHHKQAPFLHPSSLDNLWSKHLDVQVTFPFVLNSCELTL